MINTSFLQGASFDLEKEKPRAFSNYQLLSIEEKSDGSSGILTELDNRSPPNRWLLSEKQSNEIIEESALSNNSHGISNSYLLAFQNHEEKTAKYLAFKAAAILMLGFIPSIPQFAIASTVGEHYGSSLLGYCLTAATVLTVEGITSWMIWELIEDINKLTKTSNQHHPNSSFLNTPFIKGVSIGVFSLVLGALSSAPDVYKVYKYNDVKELAIISFIYDTIPRTLGFYKLFSSLKYESDKVCEEESIAKSRGKEFIDLSKTYFLKQCKENGIENVVGSLKRYNAPRELYTYLSSSFQQNTDEETLLYYSERGFPKKILEYLSLIFPLASASFDMVLAYKGYSLFIHNPILLGFLSTFSVLPTFIFSSYVIMKASGNLFDRIYLRRSKVSPSNYFDTFHPNMNMAFTVMSSLLGSTTSISGFYIISDNLESTFLSPVKYVFSTLGVASGMTFGTYTIYSSSVNFGEVIQKVCNKKSSSVLNCLKSLDNVRDSIGNSSLDPAKTFIDDIDPHQD